MVQGVGTDSTLEEGKGVAVEMGKHTKRRSTQAEGAPFEDPQDVVFSQAKGHRRTKFGVLPEEGDVDAKTPSKAMSGDAGKALDNFYKSPTRKDTHKPAQKSF